MIGQLTEMDRFIAEAIKIGERLGPAPGLFRDEFGALMLSLEECRELITEMLNKGRSDTIFSAPVIRVQPPEDFNIFPTRIFYDKD